MRALLQRVTRAEVRVAGDVVGSVGRGFLVLLGVGPMDDEGVAAKMADKVRKLRVFSDDAGKMNLALEQVEGGCLVVSQFTLYGDMRSGNRPGFSRAAPPDKAERLYLAFAEALRRAGVPVQTGEFGADMAVELVNDGPVTLFLDSEELLGSGG